MSLSFEHSQLRMNRWLSVFVVSFLVLGLCSCEDSEERRARYSEKKPAPKPRERTFAPLPTPAEIEERSRKKEKIVVMDELDNEADIVQITGLSGKNVLVVFYTPWCPHCAQYKKSLMEYAKAQKGRCYVATVDADKYPQLAREFGVDAVPKTILYVEGMRLRDMVGNVSQQRLGELIDATLSPAQ